MKALFLTLGLLTLPLASQAADGFFKQLTLPSGQVVTVSEGRGEPASTGSYDVRLYSGANPQFPLDQFIDGKVLPRDGSIKELKLLDLNGDKQPEVIVVVESAGSGSYLSADAPYHGAFFTPHLPMRCPRPPTGRMDDCFFLCL